MDKNNTLHLDIPLLLKQNGLPVKEHNKKVCIEAAIKVAQKQYPGIPINIVTAKDDYPLGAVR